MPNTNPAADTANWTPITAAVWDGQSEYPQGSYATVSVLGQTRLVRAITTISAPVATPNAAPASDTTRWDALNAVWNGQSAYGQGVYVTRNIGGQLRLFRSLGSIAAPAAGFVLYATWNNYNVSSSPNNASGTTGGSDYYAGSGASGNYRASLFVNTSPLTTGAGYTAIANNTAPPGTYRLRFDGTGLAAGVAGSIVGTVGLRQPDNAGRRALVVSPTASNNPTQRSQDMINAFGTTTPSAGGTWHLERQSGAGTPNTAPEDDSANWEEITPPAHDGNVAYAEDTVVESGGLFYESNTAIPLPTAQPNTSPASAPTQWAFPATPNWDEESAYNQDDHVRYNATFYRALQNIAAPSAGEFLLREDGDFILQEDGSKIQLERST